MDDASKCTIAQLKENVNVLEQENSILKEANEQLTNRFKLLQLFSLKISF